MSFAAIVLKNLLQRPARTAPTIAGTGYQRAPIVLVFGWETNTFVWEHLRLVSGRWPSSDREPALVLGSIVADALGKRAAQWFNSTPMRSSSRESSTATRSR